MRALHCTVTMWHASIIASRHSLTLQNPDGGKNLGQEVLYYARCLPFYTPPPCSRLSEHLISLAQSSKPGHGQDLQEELYYTRCLPSLRLTHIADFKNVLYHLPKLLNLDRAKISKDRKSYITHATPRPCSLPLSQIILLFTLKLLHPDGGKFQSGRKRHYTRSTFSLWLSK